MNNQNKKSINEKELEVLQFWQENKIFEKSLTPSHEGREGVRSSTFTFYDGPPFATGVPHHGHVLAGTIKDAIPRYQTMRGHSVRRIWGWDCHGLPIENLIEKELNLNSKKDIERYGIDKFNTAAANSVLRYEEEWKRIVPRLGRWVDMEHPYKTMDATYTESVWWSWKQLYDKGLAYEGHKIMHICPRCETPLAQSEVGLEYHDVTDLSVTTRFELLDEPRTFILAWTTTPWTLPGNTALAVNRDITYVKVRRFQTEEDKNSYTGKIYEELFYIMSKKFFVESFVTLVEKNKIIEPEIGGLYIRPEYIVEGDVRFELVSLVKGEDLIGKKYKPPFNYYYDKEDTDKVNGWKIWHADFITEDAGTGIAHEAPAFGAEDMELAKANNIPVIKHVKMDGTFVPEVTDFAGMKVKQKDDTMSADIEVIRWLAKNHLLFEKHKIVHSYPLCWRCKTPLLNYATSSWFVDVPKIKDKLISENSKVKWIPEHIRDGRFGRWLEGAREWAVSRRRYWGAPLPVWQSASGKVKVIGSLEELAELNIDKPKNKYIVMRHGECISNTKNVLDMKGDPNNHLTDKGKEVANKNKELIGNRIDIIYSSPFMRTLETANIVSDGKIKVIADDRLRETYFGGWDGKRVNEFIQGFNSLPGKYMDKRSSDSESHREIRERMADFLLDIDSKYEGKTILIVTHGGPANMLLSWAQNLSDQQIENNLFDEKSKNFLQTGSYIEMKWSKVCYDEKHEVNLHRPYIDDVKLEIDGEEYTRIPDVFDCWYESGSMPYAQLHYPFENKEVFQDNFPADFIAEGMDQTRGWFYSLINLGVGLFGVSPYKHVIVNGVVMAGDGRKMSKSEKNYTDPMILVEKYGADSLRLALANSPVMQGENVLFSDELVDETHKKIVMKLENVLNMYLMNPSKSKDNKTISDNNLDIYILAKLQEVVNQVTVAYDNYKLDEATRPLERFIDTLSVEYVKGSRDRLKGIAGEQEEMQATSTLKEVLLKLSKLLAPMAPFLAERVYRNIGGPKESVHLESWPDSRSIKVEESKVLNQISKTFDIISLILNERNKVKIPVRQPLAQAIITQAPVAGLDIELIKEMTNIKSIELSSDNENNDVEDKISKIKLDTNITEELKREGEQRELARAIKDMRRDMGLVASDNILLTIDKSRSHLIDDSYKVTMKITEVREGIELGITKA